MRAAHAAHASESRRSPNTIHSTLERLIRKGLVERRKQGRAFAYRAIVSTERRVTFDLTLINLLGSKDNDIEYYYASRLAAEPAPVDDTHVHPVEPRMLRGTVRVTF